METLFGLPSSMVVHALPPVDRFFLANITVFLRTQRWYSVFVLEATLLFSHPLSEPSPGLETSLLWWQRTAHCRSQVPVHSQFLDRNEIQPRVRQQAVMFISTVARRIGMIVCKAAGRRDTCTALKARRTHKSERKMLQNSRTATRSILNVSFVLYIQMGISRTQDH